MIGRKKEIYELNKLYNSSKAELVALYGRRRIGKTFLINNVFDGKFTFKHTGLSPDDSSENKSLSMQLNNFYRSLLSYGLKKSNKPNDWFEAFFLLQKLIVENDFGRKQVVFIDELPWLDTKKSDFLKAFESFWNNFGCSRNNLLLIVCGSANSWLLNNFINNYGGLYGRVTKEIKLSPFTLCETEEFLKSINVNLSRYDIVQGNMVFGGIPYYLNYLESNLSLAQNIDELFFKKNAVLSFEFERLFQSTFSSPDKIKSIVRLLSTNGLGVTRKEISDKLGITDGGTLSKYLNALIASDFVVKYIPFGLKKREECYKLIDPFCIFYLTFVDNKKNNEKFWSQNVSSQGLSTWRGLAFENVCFNHIEQIKQALGISGVISEASAFYNKEDGYQVDLIISRNDNVVNMCEMKYYSSIFKIDKNNYLKIMNRNTLLNEKISKKQVIHNTLITTFGVSLNEYSSVFNNVITIDDLFK